MLLSFGSPAWLWLLLVLPCVALLFGIGFHSQRKALWQVINPRLAARLAGSVSWTKRRWKAALLMATFLGGVIALAQPRWGFEWREVKHRGADIFVLLDVSKSMWTEDVRPHRLAQAKFAVQDLLAHLQGDRIGLIAFAGTAFVQCPLTVDREALRLTLESASPELIPRGGSAIGAAIQTALKAFAAGEGQDRAIVLITDGEDTEGDPLAAARAAAAEGIKIYVIGVGTTEGELIPLRTAGRGMEFVKDAAGQVVKSRLDDAVLREVALATGGIYVRSVAGDFGMETIYNDGIARLERREYETQLRKQAFERFQWLLGIALACFLTEMFLSDHRREAAKR